jgi:hypothetical protein
MKYTERPHDWAEITEEWLGERLKVIRVMSHNAKAPKVLEKIEIGKDLIEKIKGLGEKPVCGIGKLK